MEVLVVDDEPDILQSIELLWEGTGVDIVTAPSPESALAKMDHAPDVVLTDFRMPGMDGLAFIEKLHERFPGVPAVLMTAFADPNLRKRALAVGVKDFVAKPFDPDELLQRVQAAA